MASKAKAKSFGDYVKLAMEIVQLKGKSMDAVSKDKNAFKMAMLFIAIGGVASAIGSFNPIGIILNPILAIVASFVGVGILHLIAKLFGGKAKYQELYSVIGLASILQWISIIPLLGMALGGIAGLWMMVVNVIAVKNMHKLSIGKAVIVVLIPVIIAVIIAFLVALVVVAFFYNSGLMSSIMMGEV